MGHALIEGISVPVTEVSLRGGGIVFKCVLTGPVAAVEGGAVTIFGEDGTGICQGYCGDVSWIAVAPGETLMVKVEMKMDRCYGDAEAQDLAAGGPQ
jgi:hypothetical protein